jgi:hypothetical protein
MTRTCLPSTLFLTLLAIACGGDSDMGASDAAPIARSDAPPPVMGSFELPDTTFAFRLIKCDLTGTAPDGILLRGSGTMPDGSLLLPDGRRMSIEVERLTPETGGPGFLYERATVQFGSFMDEDGWEATATSMDGSRWTSDNDVLEGPIIQVSGNDLSVAATYKHASRDEWVEGTLRVTCPAPTYP